MQCFLNRSIEIDKKNLKSKNEHPYSIAPIFLKRFQEKPLWFPEPENQNKESYQLVLSSRYRSSELVKVWKMENEHFILIKRLCSISQKKIKEIYYDPQLCVVKSKITKAEWQEFEKLAKTSCYWGMIPYIGGGKDGESLTLEGRGNNRYHAVYRWMPDPKNLYNKLCSYLLELAQKYN